MALRLNLDLGLKVKDDTDLIKTNVKKDDTSSKTITTTKTTAAPLTLTKTTKDISSNQIMSVKDDTGLRTTPKVTPIIDTPSPTVVNVASVVKANNSIQPISLKDGKSGLIISKAANTIKTIVKFPDIELEKPTKQTIAYEDKTMQVGKQEEVSATNKKVFPNLEFVVLTDPIKNKSMNSGWKIKTGLEVPSYSYNINDDEFSSYKTSITEEYLENPYVPGAYFKKEISYSLVDATDGTVSTTLNNITSPITINEFIKKFKKFDRFEDDSIAKLRGQVVEDSVFENKRRDAFLSNMLDLLRDTTPDRYIRDLSNTLKYKTDSLLRIYNHAKAIIKVITEEAARDNLPVFKTYSELLDSDGLIVNLITKKTTLLVQEETTEKVDIITGFDDRGVIGRLLQSNLYSTSYSYLNVKNTNLDKSKILSYNISPTTGSSLNNHISSRVDEITRYDLGPNNNYTPSDDLLKINTNRALETLRRTKNVQSLKLDIHDTIINSLDEEETTEELFNTTDVATDENDVSVLNSLIAEPITLTGTNSTNWNSIHSILTKILVPENSLHEEVINGN